MNRKEFLKTCGQGCMGLMAGVSSLSSCASTKYFPATIEAGFMLVPLDAFLTNKEGQARYRASVIAHNKSLQYPIGIFRHSDTEYKALLLRCTHQGAELQVFGDRLECPAHGSEFSNTGTVQNGPADVPLRTFLVQIEPNTLKISLK